METNYFVDGIGRRLRQVDSNGEDVETLRLCRELSEATATEAALIERAATLAGFVHPAFARVRRVERVHGKSGGLAVVSAAVPGARLARVLDLAQKNGVAADPHAALSLLQEVSAALVALHRRSRDLSHGALGPERIIVRPDGHAVVTEHVLAPAIERMQLGRLPLWTQFRIPVPTTAHAARFDQSTDVLQLGLLALALALGRPIKTEEFPQRLPELLSQAASPDSAGGVALLRSLRAWILRTMQFETRSAFRTMEDAANALQAIVAEAPVHRVSPASVVKYLDACSADSPASPAPSAETTRRVWASTPTTPSPALAQPSEPRTGEGEAAAWMTARLPRVAPDARSADATGHARPDGHTRTARYGVATERVSPTPASPADADGYRTVIAPVFVPIVEPLARSLESAGPPESLRSSLASRAARVLVGAARLSLAHVARIDSSSVGRGARVGLVSLGLVALYGATYLGARGYLAIPNLIAGRGTLVVESRPAGVDIFVDGFASGQTPTTLELSAGEHTLALRTGKGTTLVPVMVVSGARRVEHVEIRPLRGGASPARSPRQLPVLSVPK